MIVSVTPLTRATTASPHTLRSDNQPNWQTALHRRRATATSSGGDGQTVVQCAAHANVLREASVRIDARVRMSALPAKVRDSFTAQHRIMQAAAATKEHLASYAFTCRSASSGAAAVALAGGGDCDASHRALRLPAQSAVLGGAPTQSRVSESGTVAAQMTPALLTVAFTANKVS